MHHPKTSAGLPSPWHAARRLGCAAALLLAGAGDASALTLHHVYRFDASRLQLGPSGTGRTLRAAGMPHTWERGEPEVPYDIVTLLVPRGSRLVGLRARVLAERVVAEGVSLRPASPIENDAGQVVQPKPGPEAQPIPAHSGP